MSASKSVAPRLGAGKRAPTPEPRAGDQSANRDALGRQLLRSVGWPVPPEAPTPAAVIEPGAPVFTEAERAAYDEGKAIADALDERIELLRLRVEAAAGSVGAKAALRLRKALGADK